jgi:putative transcription antitermination factor YqgF
MTALGIDFGTKTIGLAYSLNGFIFTLPPIKNIPSKYNQIQSLIGEYSIEKIYVGLSEGKIAKLTLKFVSELQAIINLPVETVEEAVSTIEAQEIQKINKKSIDSTSAAVILRRVIS